MIVISNMYLRMPMLVFTTMYLRMPKLAFLSCVVVALSLCNHHIIRHCANLDKLLFGLVYEMSLSFQAHSLSTVSPHSTWRWCHEPLLPQRRHLLSLVVLVAAPGGPLMRTLHCNTQHLEVLEDLCGRLPRVAVC